MAEYKSQAKMVAGQSISMGLSGDFMAGIEKLASVVKDSAAKSGAWAAATVLYDEMGVRVPKDQGKLSDSLYRWHDEAQSADGRQVYAIGVNKRKAPHWHLIEYGHWRHYQTVKIGGQWVTLKARPLDMPVWVPASPYIRPAFDAKIHTALDAAKQRMAARIKELTR